MFDLQFADEVKGFARPEFLIVLLSFVYGFSITDQFIHLAMMIKQRKFYHETIIWSMVITFGGIVYWFFLWENVNGIDDRLSLYAANFLPAFLIFIVVTLIYPSAVGGEYEPRMTFLKNRKRIFVAILLFVCSLILNTWWLDQFIQPINYVRLVHIVFLIPCILSDRRVFRYVAATWYLGWYTFLIITL